MVWTLFLLGLATGAGAAGPRWPLLLAVAVVLAAWAGTVFPDIDQPLALGHRSALTHSILPLAIARWRPLRATAAGLAMGIGLHLSADLFPNAMIGFATVKLPLAGSIGWQASYGWIALNAAAAFGIGGGLLGRLLPARPALAVIGAVALIGMAYLLRTDGGWWALALFGGAGWAATRRRSAAAYGR